MISAIEHVCYACGKADDVTKEVEDCAEGVKAVVVCPENYVCVFTVLHVRKSGKKKRIG